MRPNHFSKHHIADLASLIAFLHQIIQSLLHTKYNEDGDENDDRQSILESMGGELLCDAREALLSSRCNRRPRLSRSTVGCYSAKFALSNIGCGIWKQMFLQRLASLHSTDHSTDIIFSKYDNMTFKFENLFVALWGLHRAPLVSAMAWFLARLGFAREPLVPYKWTFVLVQNVHDSVLEFRFWVCWFTCRTLGGDNPCLKTSSHTTSLGH